jgi:hypothetical protein
MMFSPVIRMKVVFEFWSSGKTILLWLLRALFVPDAPVFPLTHKGDVLRPIPSRWRKFIFQSKLFGQCASRSLAEAPKHGEGKKSVDGRHRLAPWRRLLGYNSPPKRSIRRMVLPRSMTAAFAG